jgi:hypothetical protein
MHMTMNKANIYFYAATKGDLLKCLAAADVCGVPQQNAIGDYSLAWELVASGNNLVLAVGGAALYALFYNPCHWSNPAAMQGLHTPFDIFPASEGIQRAEKNRFVNAAGYTALDSLKLAVMMGYYAVHGVFPSGYLNLPRQEIPQQICVADASPSVNGTSVHVVSRQSNPPKPGGAESVGVYATFDSIAQVTSAISRGWSGIGHTAALGIRSAPYTQVLSGRPDLNIVKALKQVKKSVWWLSFWTVSWPDGGDSFHQAGFAAGEYAAKIVQGYANEVWPDYLILDPEGYNTPAGNATDWKAFISGWEAGIASVSKQLKAGFYCNQSHFLDYNLSGVSVPAFIAISPIEGNRPFVQGSNIAGYIAYFASCPVDEDITQVMTWKGQYNTVQFRDSGVDCGP